MEIWQHLLVLILSTSGLFIGSLIGKRTASEVNYAKRWLGLFGHMTLLFLLCVVFYEYEISIYGYFALAIVYGVYLKYQSRKKDFTPSILLNNVFFTSFGLLYGLLSKSPLALAFSTIVFLDGLVMGSLYTVSKKEIKDILIPSASYLLSGMLSVLVIGAVITLRQF